MTPLEQLGRDVATALGDGPDLERLARQRQKVLSAHEQQLGAGGSRSRLWWAATATAAVGAAAVGVLVVRGTLRGPAPMGREVAQRAGGTQRPVVEPLRSGAPERLEARTADGERLPEKIVRTAERALDLKFDDGTEVRVAPRSVGEIAELARPRVRVRLESGAISARVTPAASSGISWSFEAGPFQVLVVGTELSVSWSPTAERLQVGVNHGQVRVQGGRLAERGVLVSAGQALDVGPEGMKLQAPQAPQPPQPAQPPTTAGGRSAAPTERPPPAPAAPAPAAGPDWTKLARGGDYVGALSRAEADGFATLVERLSAADLALLADAARLARNGQRAQQALVALRRRFPSDEAAQMAAFRLGRLAVDLERNYAQAARWFTTYLETAPSGPFAAEAAGRLIEARAQSGDREGALLAAKKYLERYGDGPYAALARKILGSDSPPSR